MKKKSLFPVVLFFVVVGLFTLYQSSAPVSLTLVITPTVDQQPLVFNRAIYPNPGGDGLFSIRSFQFYISNIKLFSEEGHYLEPDSYHLVRFDNEKNQYTIVIDDVPNLPYEAIGLSIGVDAEANGTITVSGDVNPNSRMAWSWDVGYKFVLFEGTLHRGEKSTPLVYHIGFDENYKSLMFPFPDHGEELHATVDIMKLFQGTSTIDMLQVPTIKFDRKDSRLISDNYQNMLAFE